MVFEELKINGKFDKNIVKLEKNLKNIRRGIYAKKNLLKIK